MMKGRQLMLVSLTAKSGSKHRTGISCDNFTERLAVTWKHWNSLERQLELKLNTVMLKLEVIEDINSSRERVKLLLDKGKTDVSNGSKNNKDLETLENDFTLIRTDLVDKLENEQMALSSKIRQLGNPRRGDQSFTELEAEVIKNGVSFLSDDVLAFKGDFFKRCVG